MLKVIGASFGRTGTSSARLALEMLGFGPCHSMRALFDDASHARAWLGVAEGARPDWKRLLAGYASTVAWPASYFWRELASAYPSARVLLLRRDPDSWYASMAGTLHRTRPADGGLGPPMVVRDRAVERIVWQGTFAGRFEDRDHAISVYRSHVDDVRTAIPADRLIELDVGQGWAPLCAALGVSEPTQPFPLENTTGQYLHRAARAGVLPTPMPAEEARA